MLWALGCLAGKRVGRRNLKKRLQCRVVKVLISVSVIQGARGFVEIRLLLSSIFGRFVFIFGTALASILPAVVIAGEVRVAAAANFSDTAAEIVKLFERTSGHTAMLSFGSTGKIYAQITQGAPFDVFLAADQERPGLAESEGYAVPDMRFTYAVGRLALYSADATRVRGERSLEAGDFTRIAMANPVTAPYGTAALEALNALGLYGALGAKVVQGNTIAQTYQFVASGNAEVGFVALSQIAQHRRGSRWLVPKTLHSRIAQDGVLLLRGADNAAARDFVAFLKKPAARAVMEKFGYEAGDSP